MKQCKASKGRVLATTVSEAQVKALWLDVCRNFLIPSFIDSVLDHEGRLRSRICGTFVCRADEQLLATTHNLEARIIVAEAFLDNCFYVGSQGANEKRQGENFNKIHPAIIIDVIVQTIILGIPQHRRQVSRERQ